MNVESTDGTGNKSTRGTSIVVHHDQGQAKCPKVDASRLVDDTDRGRRIADSALGRFVVEDGGTRDELGD